jgi:hypothetical protein
MLLLTAALLAGCATSSHNHSLQALRNCPESAQSYFRGIPIASLSEHEQAERFAPINEANCAIYVFANWSSGPKAAHASIFLYRKGTEPPPLPPDYWPFLGMNTLYHPRWSDRWLLETSLEFPEFRKAEIFARDIYAMWELAPGTYVLDASVAIGAPFVRTTVTCRAGHTTYYGLTKHFFQEETLNQLDEAQGRELTQFRLRSAGKQPGGPNSPGWVNYRICPAEKTL